MITDKSIRFFKSSETITSDTITGSISFKKEAQADPDTALLFEVNGTGEFSVRFESGDGVGNWYAISELDNFTTSATQSLSSNIAILPFVRAKVDIGPGGGTVTLIRLHFRG
jgi:hypothetical protein